MHYAKEDSFLVGFDTVGRPEKGGIACPYVLSSLPGRACGGVLRLRLERVNRNGNSSVGLPPSSDALLNRFQYIRRVITRTALDANASRDLLQKHIPVLDFAMEGNALLGDGPATVFAHFTFPKAHLHCS